MDETVLYQIEAELVHMIVAISGGYLACNDVRVQFVIYLIVS